jgi:hypothetical protein
MEQVQLTVTGERRTGKGLLVPRLPCYIAWPLCLWAIIAGLLYIAIAETRQTALPTDPFQAFPDIFFRQSTAHLIAQGFTCQIHQIRSAFNEDYCAYAPSSGFFSQLRLSMIGGVSQSVSITVRDNALRVGDLVQLWGQPHRLPITGLPPAFYWPNQHVLAVSSIRTRLFAYSLPIGQIWFDTLPVRLS